MPRPTGQQFGIGIRTRKTPEVLLGEDNIYRDLILKAAKRINLVPHAICGLLECEAVRRNEKVALKDKKGQPLRHKSGKKKGQTITRSVTHEWDARSYNTSTHAAGLTQFLPSTWLDCILRPGHFISDESIAQGKPWIKMEKGQRVFVLADGSVLPALKVPNIAKEHGNDANVKACLDMRFNPEWSLMAAADYALSNFKIAAKNPEITGLDKLSDGEKIKIMYLLHHEGQGDGSKFMLNTLVVEEKKFNQNLSKDVRETWLEKAKNDRTEAYKLYLANYIDTRIKFEKFAYAPEKVERIALLLDTFKKVVKA